MADTKQGFQFGPYWMSQKAARVLSDEDVDQDFVLAPRFAKEIKCVISEKLERNLNIFDLWS